MVASYTASLFKLLLDSTLSACYMYTPNSILAFMSYFAT